jgi:hypothetical protein
MGSMVIHHKDRRSQRWSEDGYEESDLALAHFLTAFSQEAGEIQWSSVVLLHFFGYVPTTRYLLQDTY